MAMMTCGHDSRSILAMMLVVCALLLQGCADSALRQLHMLLGIVCGCLTLGMLICGCLAMSMSPRKSERQLKFGFCPVFWIMVVAWVGFGIFTANANCQMLKSMDAEACEWREPLPGGQLDYEVCCVEAVTTPAP